MNPHALAKLLLFWPKNGAKTKKQYKFLSYLAKKEGVRINPIIDRAQLKKAYILCAHRQAGYVPNRWMKYLSPGSNINQQAIKLQQGAVVPITFNGIDTTMYIESMRRLNFRGKSWYVQLKVNLSTENLPVFIGDENKCACRYCGTQPKGDEKSCLSCGAPLPDC
jgi:hypothetical protein